jgi:hypothetical protein
MNENDPGYRKALASRIVEITDENESLLIAFVPVGPQLLLLPESTQPSKGKLQ